MKVRARKLFLVVTGIVALSAGGLFFLLQEDSTTSSSPRPAALQESKPAKVKRKKIKGNATAQQLLEEGDRLKANGELDAALDNYQEAQKKAPGELLPVIKIGEVFMLQKKYQNAFDNFSYALTTAPENPALFFARARSLMGLRKFVEAKADIEKIIPPTEESRYYGAVLAVFLNEQDTARAQLADLQKNSGNEKIKEKAARLADAYARFDIARDASLTYLQALMAEVFNAIGEQSFAIEMGFTALKKEPNYRDVWIILGHSFLQEEQWHDAQDAFTRALQLDAENPTAYFFRGIARRKLSQSLEAVSDFGEALKRNYKPKVIAQEQIAETLFELGEYEKAFIFYREMVLVDSSDVARFIRPMALAINHLNEPERALELARKAQATHPQNALANALLGWGLLVNNDLNGAREYIEKALAEDPQLPAAHLNKGMLEEARGAAEKARESYQRAVEYARARGETAIENTATERLSLVNESSDAPLTLQNP